MARSRTLLDGDQPLTGPAVVDPAADRLFVARERDVAAVDLVDGGLAWTFEPSFHLGDGGLALIDGTVYVGAHDDRVYAVDAATGRSRWRTRTRGGREATSAEQELPAPGFDGSGPYCPLTGGSVQATPAVAGDEVVVGADDGRVYGLGVAGGGERWVVETGARVWARPAVTADGAYVGSTDGNCYAVADGERRWAYPLGEAVVAAPVPVRDGDGPRHRSNGWNRSLGSTGDRNPGDCDSPSTVVVGALDGPVVALDTTRTERWRAATPGVTALSVAGGTAYVAGSETLTALDLATGDRLWTAPINTRGDTAPRLRDGDVYVGTHDDAAVAVDAATGRRRWVADAEDTVTVVAHVEDRVVVGDRAGVVRSHPTPL
ncbi:MAG: PQQ-binding-like beta-propeller repeat protein [Halolamina sp.]